jgi:hypothetical protein
VQSAKLEAVSPFGTSVSTYRLHGATSQKTVRFYFRIIDFSIILLFSRCRLHSGFPFKNTGLKEHNIPFRFLVTYEPNGEGVEVNSV